MSEVSAFIGPPPPPPPPPPPLPYSPSSTLCYPGFAQCVFVLPALLANTVLHDVQLEPKAGGKQCANDMLPLHDGVSCSEDAQCQALATGFFCYRGHCCAMPNPSASSYGAACTLAEHCKFANSECSNNICYCRSGYSFNGHECVLQGAAFEPPHAPNLCLPGQVSANGRCYSYVSYGASCEYTGQCNYPGGFCYQRRCVCAPGQLYNGQKCVDDPNIPSNVACPPNQARIGGQCLPLLSLGERCTHDLQCRGKPGEQALICRNGLCSYISKSWDPTPEQRTFPKCRNPSAEVELYSGIPKDCIYQKCSPGYHCEWNSVYKAGQYICCGVGPENPIFGQPKMYPGYSNLPLQCSAINSCPFVDFPYCVNSESFRHKVCCSRAQCL
uniref:EB domain-containing protein n=1 Tax=Globodera rostochiensis TaxID=31243 RepID=A0A914GPL5_GLORO